MTFQQMSDMGGASSYSPRGEKIYTLKFVLTGSAGVGKTQLASRIVRGEFHDNCFPTVGMEFATRPLRYSQHASVRAQIWDTAGNFPFPSITEAFFRGAVGAMLVYDISRRSTFDDLVRWLALVRANCHESIALVLVGNKSDMSSKQREVSMMEGMRFARKHGLDFLETSAISDRNVEESCRQMIMSVARYLPREKSVWCIEPSFPTLPEGWVRVTVASDGGVDYDDEDDEDDDDDDDDDHTGRFLFPLKNAPPSSPTPPPTPEVAATGNHNTGKAVDGSVVMYENIWTGERVQRRPAYPAGPSEACIVSQVPRPLEPLTFLAEPVKGGDGCAGGVLKMVRTPSWNFSSWKSRGYEAASDCLSRCMET